MRLRAGPRRTRCSRWWARCSSLPEPPEPDHAADALAVAICHANGAPMQGGAELVIASVSGEVAVRRPGEVVIETAGGIGYRLAVSAETLGAVPGAGREASLHAHLILRDDGMHLFGFATEAERDLFLMLIGVQNVGPEGGAGRALAAARRASC